MIREHRRVFQSSADVERQVEKASRPPIYCSLQEFRGLLDQMVITKKPTGVEVNVPWSETGVRVRGPTLYRQPTIPLVNAGISGVQHAFGEIVQMEFEERTLKGLAACGAINQEGWKRLTELQRQLPSRRLAFNFDTSFLKAEPGPEKILGPSLTDLARSEEKSSTKTRVGKRKKRTRRIGFHATANSKTRVVDTSSIYIPQAAPLFRQRGSSQLRNVLLMTEVVAILAGVIACTATATKEPVTVVFTPTSESVDSEPVAVEPTVPVTPGIEVTAVPAGEGGEIAGVEEIIMTLRKFLDAKGDMAKPVRFIDESGEKLSFNLLNGKRLKEQIKLNNGVVEAHGVFLGSLILRVEDGRRFGIADGNYHIGIFGFESDVEGNVPTGRVIIPFFVGGNLNSSDPFPLILDHNGVVGGSAEDQQLFVEADELLSTFDSLIGRPCILSIQCGRLPVNSSSTEEEFFRFNHTAHSRSVLYGLQENDQRYFGFTYLDLDLLPMVGSLRVSPSN